VCTSQGYRGFESPSLRNTFMNPAIGGVIILPQIYFTRY
jgi:hypothetical protein